MPKAMPKQEPAPYVQQPDAPDAAIHVPLSETGSPAIELQRLLTAHFSENGQLALQTLPTQSSVARVIDNLASTASRIAGPILFVAAVAGIITLIF